MFDFIIAITKTTKLAIKYKYYWNKKVGFTGEKEEASKFGSLEEAQDYATRYMPGLDWAVVPILKPEIESRFKPAATYLDQRGNWVDLDDSALFDSDRTYESYRVVKKSNGFVRLVSYDSELT